MRFPDPGEGLCPRCLSAGLLAAGAGPGEAAADPKWTREDLAELFPELELSELLGANMGTVYKARHIALNRLVVLKAFTTETSLYHEDRQRFRHEATTLARLRHPNVVVVHDSGRRDGIDYFIMDFVAGENLRAVATANRGCEPATRARAVCGWLGAICEALQYVHDGGVIHRDIKPENIIVRPDGAPVLIDFGLAKVAPRSAGVTGLTRTEQGMGSGYYTAPEQVRDARSSDHRADLFSLGVVLFELWTGDPPVGQLPDSDGSGDSLDQLVRRIARKAMSQRPDDRYQTANDFRLALEQVVNRPHSSSVPCVPPNRPAAGPSTRVVVYALAGLMALAGMGAGGYLMFRASGKTEGAVAPATTAQPRRVYPTLVQSLLYDLQDRDWQVRKAAVKRFVDLDPGERVLFEFALVEVLEKKLDPELFRVLRGGKSEEIERAFQSAAYRSQLDECHDMMLCLVSYREAEARKRCVENLRKINISATNFSAQTLPGLPKGPEQGAGANWALLLLPYIEQDNIYQLFERDLNAPKAK